MTDTAELIQGLMYQLKGTRGNSRKARKAEGNSEELVKDGVDLQAGAGDEQGREWKGACGQTVKILAMSCWLQLLMCVWKKVPLRQNQ